LTFTSFFGIVILSSTCVNLFAMMINDSLIHFMSWKIYLKTFLVQLIQYQGLLSTTLGQLKYHNERESSERKRGWRNKKQNQKIDNEHETETIQFYIAGWLVGWNCINIYSTDVPDKRPSRKKNEIFMCLSVRYYLFLFSHSSIHSWLGIIWLSVSPYIHPFIHLLLLTLENDNNIKKL
jgi:hypothetical protein